MEEGQSKLGGALRRSNLLILWRSEKREKMVLLFLVVASTIFAVLGEEGYTEVGRMGLQLRQVLSRVEARQEETSRKVEEVGKMVTEMRSNGVVTDLSLGCTTASGESEMSEEEGKSRASEMLQVVVDSLKAAVEASSER